MKQIGLAGDQLNQATNASARWRISIGKVL